MKSLGDVEIEGFVLLSCDYHADQSEMASLSARNNTREYRPTELTLIVRCGERIRYHWNIPKISSLEFGCDGTQQMGWLNDA